MNRHTGFLKTSFLAGLLSLPLIGAAQSGATFTPGPLMNSTRIVPFMATMSDGRVVAFGGRSYDFISCAHADIYNPATNTFTDVTMNYPHDASYGVKLSSGKYFIIGGSMDLGVAPGYATTETFDPGTNTFTTSGSMNYSRCSMGAAELADGKVLIAGAWYNTSGSTYGEVYDPTGGTFTLTGSLIDPRANPLILPTADTGAVLLGGYGAYGTPSFTSVEYYDGSDNAFHAVSSEIIPSEPGWMVSGTTFLNRASVDFKMTDGRYLIGSYRNAPSLEYGLLTFDPATKTFGRIATTTPIKDTITDGGFFDLVLNKAANVAYLLGVDSATDPFKVSLTAVNLTTGVVTHPTGTFTMPASEYLYVTLAFLPTNGKILMEGISTTTGDYFHATDKTYILTPAAVTTGVDINAGIQHVSCYPNPANSTINFSAEGMAGDAVVKIYDMTGRLLKQQQNSNALTIISISIGELPAGIYLYELHNKGAVVRNKFTRL